MLCTSSQRKDIKIVFLINFCKYGFFHQNFKYMLNVIVALFDQSNIFEGISFVHFSGYLRQAKSDFSCNFFLYPNLWIRTILEFKEQMFEWLLDGVKSLVSMSKVKLQFFLVISVRNPEWLSKQRLMAALSTITF